VKTAKQLRRLIEDEFLDGQRLDDTLVTEQLDSLAIEELVGLVEDRFDVAFDDEDFVLENFRTVDALAALVDRKRAAGRR
jgi:acyl carrier protein